jgi:hypothetical protein
LSEVGGGECDEAVLSAGIGRLAPVTDNPSSSRENDLSSVDRPGRRRVRGTAEAQDHDVVVVGGAAPGSAVAAAEA